jgi:hypothetical protein
MNDTCERDIRLPSILRLKKPEQQRLVETTKRINMQLLQLGHRAMTETEVLHILIDQGLPLLVATRFGDITLIGLPGGDNTRSQMDLLEPPENNS